MHGPSCWHIRWRDVLHRALKGIRLTAFPSRHGIGNSQRLAWGLIAEFFGALLFYRSSCQNSPELWLTFSSYPFKCICFVFQVGRNLKTVMECHVLKSQSVSNCNFKSHFFQGGCPHTHTCKHVFPHLRITVDNTFKTVVSSPAQVHRSEFRSIEPDFYDVFIHMCHNA